MKAAKAANLRAKQKMLTESIRTWPYRGIKELDRLHPQDTNTTLKRFIMSIKSVKDKGRNLFLAVEQQFDNGEALVFYQDDLHAEVRGIIPSLPLIVSGHWGGSTARTWFNHNA